MMTPATTAVPGWVVPLLRCPRCRGPLEPRTALTCLACGTSYPLEPAPLLVRDPAALRGWGAPVADEILERRCAEFRARSWIGDAMIDGLEPGVPVLSVAEGHGEMTLRLAARRPDVRFVGSDFAPERVAWAQGAARRRGLDNVWFCVADATSLPFADAAFPVGYARGLLQVFRDPAPAIAELRRVLRTRLLVDQLGNRPFLVLWFWLFQQVEHVRARVHGRAPNRRIWAEIQETLPALGAYWPLWRYRRWFHDAREARVLANTLFVWETGRHRPILGWLGYGGAIDVRF
jgi:SAM-dependent methyltransferase